jgi:hypothetical protein
MREQEIAKQKMITDRPGEKQAHDPDVVATAVVTLPTGTTLVGGKCRLSRPIRKRQQPRHNPFSPGIHEPASRPRRCRKGWFTIFRLYEKVK